MYRAVLDTCVLVPGLQRDFLLQLAAEEAYAPLWGSGILLELDYVLARLDDRRERADSEQRRTRLFARMERAFPGARIEAPKDGVYDYGLNDPDDGHVVHAAIIGKADAIVTDDTRAGFRTSAALLAASIEVVYPREFAASSAAAHPDGGVRALRALAQRRTNPAASADVISHPAPRSLRNDRARSDSPPAPPVVAPARWPPLGHRVGHREEWDLSEWAAWATSTPVARGAGVGNMRIVTLEGQPAGPGQDRARRRRRSGRGNQ